MLLRPVFGVFSGEFPILYWPLLLFTPGLLKHSIQFNSPATSIITKFCRAPSVSRWRFIFPGWKFCVLSALSSDFCSAGALSVWSASIVIFTPFATKVRGLDITCGCFGHASQHWSFPSHLATNLAIGPSNNSASLDSRTRWIVFVAAPGVEILDLVGPLQVFARASAMHSRASPGSAPIYSVEVVTISWARLHAKRRPAVTQASAANRIRLRGFPDILPVQVWASAKCVRSVHGKFLLLSCFPEVCEKSHATWTASGFRSPPGTWGTGESERARATEVTALRLGIVKV